MKVIWNESACTHAGECVKGLPQVFKVENDKFVIDESGASEEAIRRQVAQCPSNALTVEE